jgi:von Willebrand factor type D domain
MAKFIGHGSVHALRSAGTVRTDGRGRASLSVPIRLTSQRLGVASIQLSRKTPWGRLAARAERWAYRTRGGHHVQAPTSFGAQLRGLHIDHPTRRGFNRARARLARVPASAINAHTTSTGSSSQEIFVSGTISWTDFGGAVHPARHVKVRIATDVPSDVNTVMTETDSTGYYEATLSPPPFGSSWGTRTITVTSDAEDDHAGLVTFEDGDAYFQDASQTGVEYGDALEFDYTIGQDVDNQTEDEKAFAIHDTLYSAYLYGAIAGGGSDPRPTVFYPNTSDTRRAVTVTGSEDTDDDGIFLGDWEWSAWDVITHEYGHWFDYWRGIAHGSPGGTHFIRWHLATSRGEDEHGNPLPGAGKYGGTALAWKEGYGDYYSLSVSRYVPNPDVTSSNIEITEDDGTTSIVTIDDASVSNWTYEEIATRPDGSHAGFQISTDGTAQTDDAGGEDNERAITGFLWNLESDANAIHPTGLTDTDPDTNLDTYGDAYNLGPLAVTTALQDAGAARLSDFVNYVWPSDDVDLVGNDPAARPDIGCLLSQARVAPYGLTQTVTPLNDLPWFEWSPGNFEDFPNNMYQVDFFDADDLETPIFTAPNIYTSGWVPSLPEWTAITSSVADGDEIYVRVTGYQQPADSEDPETGPYRGCLTPVDILDSTTLARYSSEPVEPPVGGGDCGTVQAANLAYVHNSLNYIAKAHPGTSYPVAYMKPAKYIKSWIGAKKRDGDPCEVSRSGPGSGSDPGPGSHSGGGWGDPHLTTLDGLSYNIQSVGEFELLKAPDLDLDLQARFVPWQGSDNVAIMDRISFTDSGVQVEIDSDNHVLVDGEAISLPDHRLLYFGDGAQLLREGDEYLVVWPMEGGQDAAMSWSHNRVSMRISDGIETSGLLGNNDGNALNDLVTADGVPAGTSRETFIHTAFADSYRVSDETSLFTYDTGESTETYTDTEFPAGLVRIGDYPINDQEDAEDACAEAAAGSAHDGCVYDFLATDGQMALDAALEVPSSAVSVDELTLGDSGTAGVDFESSVPINFANDRLSYDAEAGGFAGSFREGDPYQFALPISSSHTGVNYSMDFLIMGNLTVSRQRYAQVSIEDLHDDVRFSRAGAAADTGTVTLAGTGTLSDGRPFKRYHYGVTVPPTDANLEGQVDVHGFTKYQQDALGVDNIEVTLQSPTAVTRVPIQMGDVIVPSGDGSLGVVEQYGQRDAYSFSVPEDNYPVTIAWLSGPDLDYVCDQLVLRRVDTGAIVGGCGDDMLLAAGDYEIRVSAPRDAPLPFRYAFQLHGPLTPVEYGPIDVDTSLTTIDDTTGGGLGTTQGDLNYLELQIDVQDAGTLNLGLTCTSPGEFDCQNATSITNDTTHTPLPNGRAGDVVPGPYTVRVYSNNGPEDYQLTLQVLADDTHAIEFGDVVKPTTGGDMGVLSLLDQRDRYTFDVPAGGKEVTLGLLPAFLQFFYPPHNPWGAFVCNRWRLANDNGYSSDGCVNHEFLSEGTYTLDVYAPESEPLPFKYGFQHTQTFETEISSTAPTVVTPDEMTGEGILENLAASDVYTFTAATFGQLQVSVDCEESEAVRCPLAVLSDEDGWVNPQTMELIPGHHYDVTVAGGSGGQHEYSLTLTPTSPYSYPLGDDLTTNSAGAGSGHWAYPGDLDLYSFEVPEGGASLAFDGDAISGLSLYDTDGNAVSSEWSPTGYVWNLDGGDYIAEALAPWSGDEGRDYAFRLYEVPATTSASIDVGTWDDPEMTPGTFTRSAASASYTFTLDDPETVVVDITGDASAELVDLATDTAYGIGGRTALTAGDYKINVYTAGKNYDDTFGTYTYSVGVNVASPVDTQPLVFGDKVTPDAETGIGHLDDPHAEDALTFTIPPGGLEVSFLAQGQDCTGMWLESDSGTVLDCGVFGFPQLLDEGEYTLFVAANGSTDGFAPSTYSLLAETLPDYDTTPSISVPVGTSADALSLSGTFQHDAQIHDFGFDLDEEDVSIHPYLLIERTDASAPYSLMDQNGNRVFTERTCNWHIVPWPDAGAYSMQTTGAQGEDFTLEISLRDDWPSGLNPDGCYGGGS